MKIIDGNLISQEILGELKTQTAELIATRGIVPQIIVICVGDDPASLSYVKKKEKTAKELGFKSFVHFLPASISQPELEAIIDGYNADPSVHGILVQAPLPKHINQRQIFNRVLPEKDVDGFSTLSIGGLVQEIPGSFVACTPAGVLELLLRTGTKICGTHIVVVGCSLIVGRPLATLLLNLDATVTVCHSKTQNLAAITREADVLVVAIGCANFFRRDMVKPGAVVIDVGINRIPDPTKKSGFRLVGDVDFDDVAPICSAITPVPGGVGPMTVTMLMKNTLLSALRAAGVPAIK